MPLEGGDQHRLHVLRRQRCGQPRRSATRADPVERSAGVGRDHPAAAGRDLACPGLRRVVPPRYPWDEPLGARVLSDGQAQFRVWAPRAETVAVRVGERDLPLEPSGFGVYERTVEARAGETYWFLLDGRPLPDPCSRHQPQGLRGPSRLVAPAPPPNLAAAPGLEELVVYELHIGTFSGEGTFAGAIPHLAALA